VPDNDIVIVLEDDADIRDSIVEVLLEDGFEARGFTNGAEALDYLRSGGVASMILLDVMMPIMDGVEFRREIEKDPALAAIPVVVLTAAGDAQRRAAAMRVSAGLNKPVRIDALLSLVESHCRRRG
jgi:DNA-binding response OmpR family regulator